MGLRCSSSVPCSPAIFDNPPEPAWGSGAFVTYTNTQQSGGAWGYQPNGIPSWVTVTVTASSISFAGTRPNAQAFTLAYQLISCGVTTDYTLDYPGTSSVCAQCLFTLSTAE
jgi:hypothetical protein